MTKALSRCAHCSIFLVAATVVLLQVALTRVISATASYHSAFIVLSVVMLGIAASGVAVYRDVERLDGKARQDKALQSLVRAGVFCTLALILYFLIYRLNLCGSYLYAYAIAASVFFYPTFFYSGYVIAYLLHENSEQIGSLYWSDLAGASIACLIIVSALNLLGAPYLIICCSALFASTSFILRRPSSSKSTGSSLNGLLAISTLLISAGAFILPSGVTQTVPGDRDSSLLILEKWNSLAKVSVYKEAPALEESVNKLQDKGKDLSYMKRLWGGGWGFSPRYNGPIADHYYLDIDSGASTIIVGGKQASAEELNFLKWDVTAIAYWLLDPNQSSRAFIIGGGGGRDIWTANTFGVDEIDVVELNRDIIDIVENDFSGFSGGPYSLPNVSLTQGEARSVLERNNLQYDLIQMSMIDTFAATSSGAFVLAENNLYTVEAISLFLEKITDSGFVSISRWHSDTHRGELGKMLALLREALLRHDVSEPAKHVAVVHSQGYLEQGVANMLVKRTPFSSEEIEKLKLQSEKMGFSIVWPLQTSEADSIIQLLDGATSIAGLEEYDFRPSTDDWPFFFNSKRPFTSWLKAIKTGDITYGSLATTTMLGIVLMLLLATLRLVYRPLKRASKTKESGFSAFGVSRYFAGIGFGFMVLELGMLQRYILFLGHPTYALTVVLFVLLLFSGLGSAYSSRVQVKQFFGVATWPILWTILGAAFAAGILPLILQNFFHLSLISRVAVAVVCIAPFAFAMGMIFPLGVRALNETGRANLIPMMWGVNGIFSVFGSVVGMWLATTFGYTTVFVVGALSYVLTLGFKRDASI